MCPTLTDWSAELQEALWEVGAEYGVRLEVSQQVAIARLVAAKEVDAVSPGDIQTAFETVGLRRPPASYARTVLASIRGVPAKKALLNVLIDYRAFAIRSLSRQFGGKTAGHEDALRNNLLTFLPTRGYTEAHTGKGQTDILIPSPDDAIIEVKVWTNERTYCDGLEELARYIHTEQPKQAYMVVFGDREPLPPIVGDPDQAVASTRELEGLIVPTVVIPFEVDAPSRAASEQRKRDRGNR